MPAPLRLIPLRPVLTLFALLTGVTGIVYPLLVTGIGRSAFAHQASGSLLMRGHRLVGSRLIAQSFEDPGRFWGRPSATAPMANNGLASGGSNLGPTNPALIEAVKLRIAVLERADPTNALPIPVDLVTASASGLDPHISPAAALYQVPRVARSRGLDPAMVRALVMSHTEPPQWGVFGEPRVNVLLLNLGLDRLPSSRRGQ